LNFTISEEDSSDPETHDIRNEAFWKKLSGIFEETLEMLKESAKEWGVDLDTLDSADDTEKMKARDEAAENHLLCRAARKYAEMVKEWVDEKETLFFETAAAARDGVDLDEAVEVIQWYQYFICAKITRAVRGKIDDEEERDDQFPSDSDGSAKIGLIAMDRSIAAWAMIRHYVNDGAEAVVDLISFLDGLRLAVEKTFPKARSFVRPGFESFDLNG
jgi:hypothetical protein